MEAYQRGMRLDKDLGDGGENPRFCSNTLACNNLHTMEPTAGLILAHNPVPADAGWSRGDWRRAPEGRTGVLTLLTVLTLLSMWSIGSIGSIRSPPAGTFVANLVESGFKAADLVHDEAGEVEVMLFSVVDGGELGGEDGGTVADMDAYGADES